ncbi:hypothetical protein DFR52_103447 [Hoeflea marina]|uniref:Uncharacterized protein n=1 Tax=Hoeflea marina TaxID=274592 RepID=A0A317PIU3_9HYPH|nr:hypothetical protein [Hoeflea marina]PWW00244.1 hypothetical protein DFR52_103447 [Hoeflea marina]
MSDLLRILVSPAAWLACFSAIYGLSGIVCAAGPGAAVADGSGPRMVLVIAFLLAVLLQVGLLALVWSARFGAEPGLVRVVSRISAVTGLVATVWTLFPVLAASACL